MACLPGWAQELPLSPLACRRLFLALLLLATLGPAPVRGQADPADPPAPVGGYLELAPTLSRIAAQSSAALRVSPLLGLTSGWRAGGAAYFFFEPVDVHVPQLLRDLELNTGYGGLLVERVLAAFGRDDGGALAPEVSTRWLLGGGNAEIRDPSTGSPLWSDNFLVIEPALLVSVAVHRYLAAGASAAYRFAIGVDGLPGVEESDLRGVSLAISIRAGPF